VVEKLIEMDAPRAAEEAGNKLRAGLAALPRVVEVRGSGLILAVELLGIPASEAAQAALGAGLVVNAVTSTALRLTPPLNVSEEEIEEALQILAAVLA
jgi:acetylornithine aminotransferase